MSPTRPPPWRSMYRVLKPGGQLLVLEFSTPVAPGSQAPVRRLLVQRIAVARAAGRSRCRELSVSGRIHPHASESRDPARDAAKRRICAGAIPQFDRRASSPCTAGTKSDMPATPAWLASIEALLNRSIGQSMQAAAARAPLEQHLAADRHRQGMLAIRAAVSADRLALMAGGDSRSGCKHLGIAFGALRAARRPHASRGPPHGRPWRGAAWRHLERQWWRCGANPRRCGDRKPLPGAVRSGAPGSGGGTVPAGRRHAGAPLVAGSRKAALAWARKAGRTAGENLAEYLQEESRDLVSQPELEEFLLGRRSTARNGRPRRSPARAARAAAEGHARDAAARRGPAACRSSARWSGTAWMISFAQRICIGRSGSCSISRHGPGFSAAPASPAANDCVLRSRSSGRSSSNSARRSRRAAICCRSTSPTSWRNCRTACRRSRSAVAVATIELAFARPLTDIFQSFDETSRWPRPRSRRCMWRRSRAARKWSSKYCAPGCTRSSNATSRSWRRSRSLANEILGGRAAAAPDRGGARISQDHPR